MGTLHVFFKQQHSIAESRVMSTSSVQTVKDLHEGDKKGAGPDIVSSEIVFTKTGLQSPWTWSSSATVLVEATWGHWEHYPAQLASDANQGTPSFRLLHEWAMNQMASRNTVDNRSKIVWLTSSFHLLDRRNLQDVTEKVSNLMLDTRKSQVNRHRLHSLISPSIFPLTLKKNFKGKSSRTLRVDEG